MNSQSIYWIAGVGIGGLLASCSAGEESTSVAVPPAQYGAGAEEAMASGEAPREGSAPGVVDVTQAPLETAPIPVLRWEACAEGFECATARLPRDYRQPRGATLNIAITRLPARNVEQRIGALFVNFGGPGGDAVATLHAFGKRFLGKLNQRFDIVGFDPRGTGESELPVDCHVNQSTEGVYAQPFTTPQRLGGLEARAQSYVEACVSHNAEILPHVATANVARDMDTFRAALGDEKLSYLGFSYGTFLGATYASLFPRNYRALVLDGAADADRYINQPSDWLLQQSASFERALGRFFQACAADQEACLGFGRTDPHGAFDRLVARANANPLPVSGGSERFVTGEDILFATSSATYAKQLWPRLARALAQAQAGDGSLFRAWADSSYGRRADGSYSPGLDRYFALSAVEQRYTSDLETFLESGSLSWGLFDHAWWNAGYSELPWGLMPIRAKGVFRGPFRASRSGPTVLVIGTTYDPATPYRAASALVAQLRNARLLTHEGDGHTAYGGNSPCIDAAVEAYLTLGAVPPAGTVCKQEVPFVQPRPVPYQESATAASLREDIEFVKALR